MSEDARADEEKATQRRAMVLGLSYADTSLGEKPLYRDLMAPEDLKRHRVVPISADPHHINFGVTNTTSQQTMQEIRDRFLDQRVSFSLISDTGFKDYMLLYDPPKKVEYQDVKFSQEGDSDLFSEVTATLNRVLSDDILAYLVKQTYQLKGSDIHLENQKESVRVRIRIDGVLHPIAQLTHEKYHQLLSSIAIAANVSTSDPDPQTGHINRTYKMATGEDVTVNLRVETVPTVFGQDVVMRLFNLRMELLKLDNLGLSDSEREAVDDVIKHPTGMVLIVGPTGSGKTTTLYSLINTLNAPERKIITLEDPVEYVLEGIVQIPVAGDQDVTGFADHLRAVLRLDPDVVMVGEIRDQDTARTSLQAALTGHLVLSTFHASSAAAALTRMLDSIGINPLFSSAMHLVMAQRLIRKLDDDTKEPFKPDKDLLSQLQAVIDTLPPKMKKPDLHNLTLYKPKKTKENPFGFKGQIAIREQFRMTPGVRELLRKPPNEITTDMLEQKAIEEGMTTMLQDGVLKIINGETTIEEVYRVVS